MRRHKLARTVVDTGHNQCLKRLFLSDQAIGFPKKANKGC
jgi:hypothetical protein